MLQLCVYSICLDIEHLGSLEGTQEARPLSCSPNFPRAQYLDIRSLTPASTNCQVCNFYSYLLG